MSPWTWAEEALRHRVERLRTRASLRACDALGEGAVVLGAPFVDNRGRITIGRDFRLASIPVRSHLATRNGGRLVIGDRVRIAHGAAIFAEGEVIIGDDVSIGPMVMILDVDFHEIADRTARGTPRPIRIGRGVHLSAGCIVLRGAVLGDGAHVGPHSVVARAVPKGMRVEGVPARPCRPELRT